MAQADYTKRSNKYRHIYGDLHKPEKQYLEIPAPLTSGEGSYVKASGKFFAFSSTSAQKLYVRKLDQVGRYQANSAYVGPDCLKGKIWDFDFNPFIDSMIAMGDDSGKVAVVNVPNDGLTKTITEATVDLGQVHGKKVALVEFHPAAASILSTGSFDRSVQIFNIETQSKIASFDNLGDNIYSLKWNRNGSLLGVSSKDKKIRMFDPRNMHDSEAIQVIDAFDGSKSSKIFWIPRLNWIGATGFNKQAKREMKMWDLRDTSKPIYSNKIDQASSVLMPHYDNDNGILYMPGKGEGTVQFGEIVNDSKKFYPLGAYRNPEPQKGGGWVPKRSLNVWKCEVQRFLKLTGKAIKPVSFIVPRKAGADVFQDDIYPDAVSTKPAMTADEWINGANNELNLMKLDPSLRNDQETTVTTFVKKATYADLEKENKELKARVAELEAKLGISSSADADADAAGATDEKQDDADATMATTATEDAGAATNGDAGDAPADTPADEAGDDAAGGDDAGADDGPADDA